LRFLMVLIFGIAILAVQTALLPVISGGMASAINLPLIFFIFASVFSSRQSVLALVAVLGLLIDISASTFFGFFILIFMAEFLILKFFQNNVLRNKNLFSFLALNWLGIFIWKVVYIFLFYGWLKFQVFNFSEVIDWRYLLYGFYGFICHTLIILILYVLLPGFKRRLNDDIVN